MFLSVFSDKNRLLEEVSEPNGLSLSLVESLCQQEGLQVVQNSTYLQDSPQHRMKSPRQSY